MITVKFTTNIPWHWFGGVHSLYTISRNKGSCPILQSKHLLQRGRHRCTLLILNKGSTLQHYRVKRKWEGWRKRGLKLGFYIPRCTSHMCAAAAKHNWLWTRKCYLIWLGNNHHGSIVQSHKVSNPVSHMLLSLCSAASSQPTRYIPLRPHEGIFAQCTPALQSSPLSTEMLDSICYYAYSYRIQSAYIYYCEIYS